MRNVLVELNNAISNALLSEDDIEFVNVKYEPWDGTPIVVCSTHYSELRHFFRDVDYDAGYGTQELFGIVKFKDNSWLQRGEYDGSEWWEHMSPPEMPEELR